ncbi:TDT family transporter [Streptomyces sp. NA04227]|uniref:TDT family transporter n=1 Tax=Streptomyces sp. NA04227 TaxID=2742136 RepID=UPI001591E7DE|nr:TDT family transporter [Streptomyces sp. NA04227]QKW10687.1 TDT family transporter [Streptomyces sp. NA04227]
MATPTALPLAAEKTRAVQWTIRELTPNWYAAVMGTAIVATAGAALPLRIPGLSVVWALSAMMLAVLLCARAVHWVRHGDRARAHLGDPAVAPFYGCLSMAVVAVGHAGLAVGQGVIGERAAVAVDALLWSSGTLVGLVAAVVVPYLMITRHRITAAGATPVWLLPLVAPMVSAATGPALMPYLPEGQWRDTLGAACLAMFGLSLLAVLTVVPLVVHRLLHHGALPLALTPSLFLVLGPLGQSTTAAGSLADASPLVPGSFAALYGVPVMGFALLWFALALALVVRARRRGMGFAMTWWAFTFPVGTCATGAASLAAHTGLYVFDGLAVLAYAWLVAAWLLALWHTSRGLYEGSLLRRAT